MQRPLAPQELSPSKAPATSQHEPPADVRYPPMAVIGGTKADAGTGPAACDP